MTHLNSTAESDRTFVMPDPGGTLGDTAAPGGKAPVFASELADIRSGSNPLVAAANPLLNLIYQIRVLVHNTDASRLRDYLAEAVREFELCAKSMGVSQEHVLAARYCLCTVLDETAAQTPWGGSGVWSKNSLLVTFHNETWGGEKFFQLLAKLVQSPHQHGDLLELMYFCITLGFEGRYRIITDGKSQLETLKHRLAEIIRDLRGGGEKRLSPHWEGVGEASQDIWRILPVWVSAVLGLLLGALIYMIFSFFLAERSDRTFGEIGRLRLPEIAIPKTTTSPLQLARFLEPEIKAKLVAVDEYQDHSTVTILGDGLFDSGSTNVRPNYIGILGRIADAIREHNGKNVTVIGHTDDVPIRTLRFPSNWELSTERAKMVSSLMSGHLGPERGITVQGRGSSEPVAPNTSAENRARNRRVEITVYVSSPELKKEIR